MYVLIGILIYLFIGFVGGCFIAYFDNKYYKTDLEDWIPMIFILTFGWSLCLFDSNFRGIFVEIFKEIRLKK